MPSGGPRTPANPAPVSGPGRLSQRTDGGAGSPHRPLTGAAQPIRAASGGSYGDRKAIVQQQQAAPLPAGGPRTGGGAGSSPAPQPPTGMSEGIFGPTRRPGEPITAGIPSGPGSGGGTLLPNDPDEVLRTLYAVFPHEDIRRLLQRRASNG